MQGDYVKLGLLAAAIGLPFLLPAEETDPPETDPPGVVLGEAAPSRSTRTAHRCSTARPRPRRRAGPHWPS